MAVTAGQRQTSQSSPPRVPDSVRGSFAQQTLWVRELTFHLSTQAERPNPHFLEERKPTLQQCQVLSLDTWNPSLLCVDRMWYTLCVQGVLMTATALWSPGLQDVILQKVSVLGTSQAGMQVILWGAAGSCSKVSCAVSPWLSLGVAGCLPHSSVLTPKSGQFPGCDRLLDFISRPWLWFLHTLCPQRHPSNSLRIKFLLFMGLRPSWFEPAFNWHAIPRILLLSVAQIIASPQWSLISLGLNLKSVNFELWWETLTVLHQTTTTPQRGTARHSYLFCGWRKGSRQSGNERLVWSHRAQKWQDRGSDQSSFLGPLCHSKTLYFHRQPLPRVEQIPVC